jgi:hypothetical protein
MCLLGLNDRHRPARARLPFQNGRSRAIWPVAWASELVESKSWTVSQDNTENSALAGGQVTFY